MNLFLSTKRMIQRGDGPASGPFEDHLTEFLAAALTLDETLRTAYCAAVLADFAKKQGWGSPVIVEIETQPCFDNGRPDMQLRLADGKRVACEHKLDAPETPGPESGRRDQLERYLALESVDAVVYVRATWKAIPTEVLSHPKYVHPAARDHFLWRDLYGILEGNRHPFVGWVREGFKGMGFVPPHPVIGDLQDADRAAREDFAKYWDSTQAYARALGWEVSRENYTGLNLNEQKSGRRSPVAERVWVSPATASGAFLISVTPRDGLRDEVEERLSEVAERLGKPTAVTQVLRLRSKGTGKRPQVKVETVNVTTSLAAVLGVDTSSPDERERRLHDFVVPFLQALDRPA
jgi:hypothetical protein